MAPPHRLPVLVAALLACASTCFATEGLLRLNEVYMTGSHNSYQRYESLHDQMNYDRIRSVELDANTGAPYPSYGKAVTLPNAGDDPVCLNNNPIPGNWWVYHVCLVDTVSLFTRLSDGFQSIMSFHNANPQHEFITLFMDMKDGLNSGGQSPEALDALMVKIFGAALFAPADLLAHATAPAATLVDAVTAPNGWPTLLELRGRIMVILTDGQDTYATTDDVANKRKAFLAVSSPTSFSDKGYHVVYNQDGTDPVQAAFTSQVHARGFISRHYYSNDYGNNDVNWARSIANKANFIAHNLLQFHQYQKFYTFNMTTGYPFQSYVLSTAGLREPQHILSIRVTSSDVGGRGDNCVFLTTKATREWSTQISTANHLMPFPAAKGGLMMRESLDPGSRYFAVLRMVEGRSLRMQFRQQTGGDITVFPGFILPTGNVQTSADFVRASCERNGTDTICRAYGSFDGEAWTQIGVDIRFSGIKLAYAGPFASSKGPALMQDGNSGIPPLEAQTKLVFTNLKQGGDLKTSKDLQLRKIGAVYLTPIVRDSVF